MFNSFWVLIIISDAMIYQIGILADTDIEYRFNAKNNISTLLDTDKMQITDMCTDIPSRISTDPDTDTDIGLMVFTYIQIWIYL